MGGDPRKLPIPADPITAHPRAWRVGRDRIEAQERSRCGLEKGDFDVGAARRKIQRAGLPAVLGDRLVVGL